MSQTFSLNLKIAGKAGEGIMVSAKIFARLVQKLGLQVFNYYEYPSLIKGGHQTGQIYAARETANCQKRELDILLLLDVNSLNLHKAEITPETIIVGEFANQQTNFEQLGDIKAKFYNLPLEKIAVEAAGSKISINAVASGVAIYLSGMEFNLADLGEVIQQEFAEKEEVQQKVIAAFQAGYDQAKQLAEVAVKWSKEATETLLLTGNEAIGLGAIAAGLQYYSAYPMTPASGLMHYLAEQQKNYPLVVKHVEDEIAAINQAVGASFAGVRAMTGSAGGGFALMVETLSMLGVAEVPLAILVAQRGAPGTGLPTWNSQADLQFVLRAGHGDFQRVILTPGTVAEHFEAGKQALVFAEKYQLPVIILSDKFILESYQTMPKPAEEHQVEKLGFAQNLPTDGSYRRYAFTENGISPRSIPGQDYGLGITNSYEHDEFGFATEESEMIKAQVEKRQRKLVALKQELPQPIQLGPKQAKITLVGWGSTVNVFQQLLAQLDEEQNLVNMIHLPCVWPFPVEQFSLLAAQAKKLVMVEANSTGQAAQLIRQETGIEVADKILSYDGRPFYVEDLAKWLEQQA